MPPSDQIHGNLLTYKITAESLSVADVRREVEIVHNVVIVHGSLLWVTVNGLKSFNEYKITVQAVNEHGEGLAGETAGG